VEQAAAGQCAAIVQNFTDATRSRALAGIATLTTDIGNDVAQDPAVEGRAVLVGLHDQERLQLPPGLRHSRVMSVLGVAE
jgi:hypothetical protein